MIYDYITDKIFDYFSSIQKTNAEKYFISFDEIKDVDRLREAMQKRKEIESFKYEDSMMFDQYETIIYETNNNKYVIAFEIEDVVNKSFFVRLRNSIGESNYEGYSVLFIFAGELDSLTRGAISLMANDMPLNINKVKENLQVELKESLKSEADMAITQYILEKTKDDYSSTNSSVFDFGIYLEIIEAQEIKIDNFEKFNMFPCFIKEGLFDKKTFKSELKKNEKLFHEVQNAHLYGNKESIKNEFVGKVRENLLKSDSWVKEYFHDVVSSNDKALEKAKIIYVDSENSSGVSKSVEGLTVWNSPDNETAGGRRNRNIIIFNPKISDEVNIELKFNKSLNIMNIKIGKEIADVKGHKILVKVKKHHFSNINYVNYSQDGKTASKFNFKIIVLPINSEEIEAFQDCFKIPKYNRKLINDVSINVSAEKSLLIGNDVETRVFSLGDKSEISLDLSSYSAKLNISEYISEEKVLINCSKNDNFFRIECDLNESKTVNNIDLKDIYAKKMQFMDSFEYEDAALKQGVHSFKISNKDIHEMIKIEKMLINDGWMSMTIFETNYDEFKLEVPYELREIYSKICDEFSKNKQVPLLSYWSRDLTNMLDDFVNTFFKIIRDINENSTISNEFKNLIYIGSVRREDKIFLTSLSPIVMMHQLTLRREYSGLKFPKRFNDFINASEILPYFYSGKTLYCFDGLNSYPGWVSYTKYNQSLNRSTKYLDKIVKDKLNQYIEHFRYSFIYKSNPLLSINIVNLHNVDSFCFGIFDFIVAKIRNNKIYDIPDFIVNHYADVPSVKNNIDYINSIYDVEQLEEKIGYNFTVKGYDKRDVIKIIREKIVYYTHYNVTELQKSHITFTEMQSTVDVTDSVADLMNSGMMIGGVCPTTQITKESDLYRKGFGKKYLDEKSSIMQNAITLNEYAFNSKGNFISNYTIGKSISLTISDYGNYEKIFNISDWVVFISPDVDLEYFNQLFDDVIILHYNDQFTNTSSYDAITLTKNSEKYNYVLKNYLREYEFNNLDNTIDKVINVFNAINGEWLLKLVGSNSYFPKEKMSMLSAVKELVALFNEKDTLWVPVSLEEILRVSGSVGLSGAGGIFSVKELDKHGSKSDDLLLIGLTLKDESVEISYLPVEVKCGQNRGNTIVKAYEQIKNTSDTLTEYLLEEDGNMKLQRDIFTNFFVNVAMSTYRKLTTFNILKERREMVNGIEKCILNNRIENKEFDTYGKGIIFSFKTECASPTFEMKDDYFYIEMNEKLAFRTLERSVEEICKEYERMEYVLPHIGKTSVQNESRILVDEVELSPSRTSYSHKLYDGMLNEDTNYNKHELIHEKNINELNYDTVKEEDDSLSKLGKNQEFKILLGHSKIGAKPIYWEFKHSELQNRHLLITGSSGSGKTYAIQALLYEVSKGDIPVVIFDYTDGFTSNQLAPEFKTVMGDKIQHHLIIRDKLGINPFTKHEKDMSGYKRIDSSVEVAQRIASTMKNVYSFGDQQTSAVYESVRFGIDELDNKFSLDYMIDYLNNSTNRSSDSVISKLRPFVDSKIFETSESLKWNDIRNSGKVHIFQLTGYTRDIQTLITDFLLWDLWNYFSSNGTESKPIVVVLDEAQNLSHAEDSPSGKILTEGRKFGISGWYATQFLRKAVEKDEIERLQQATQKLYFKPTDTGVDEIASYLSSEKEIVLNWKKRLRDMTKGECISVGYGIEMNKLRSYKPQIIKIDSFENRTK